MQLSELDLPPEIISVLEKSVKSLNPPQAAAVKAGLLERKNLIVASPTASGKTFIAELAFLKNFLKQKDAQSASGGFKKTVYLVPLKALASEKYQEFKEKYEGIGMKIAIAVGDLDETEPWLGRYDLIIASNEKMDSLLRHNADWIRDVSLIVADEVHLLNDASRGPVLEIVLTRLRSITNAQIIALSATIKNADEIAKWLDAKLVKSDYRPVKLHNGIYYPDGNAGTIEFLGKEKRMLEGGNENEISLSAETLSKKKQALVFLSTRRSAEATAEKIGKSSEKFLNREEKEKLSVLSNEALGALSNPTKQCRRLSALLKQGVAFHHAGLVAKQRKIVEDAFRAGAIKILTATPTLCLDSSVKIWNGMTNVNISKMKPRKVWALNKERLVEVCPKNLAELDAPEKMVKIKSVSGDEIIITPNHKVLIKKPEAKKLVEASSCKPNDKIALVGQLEVKPIDTPKWSDFIIENKLPFEDKILDGDVFYLIGVMLGDGYSGAEIRDGRILYKGSPCIVGRDIEVFNRIKIVCHKYSIHYKEGKNYYGVPQLVLSKSRWLREFLVRCGVDACQKRCINEKFLYSQKAVLSNLLQGLFDTDGCVEKRTKRVSFSNNSSNLIDAVRKSLLRYGIVTSFRKQENRVMEFHKKTCCVKLNAELYIQHRECLVKFYKEVGFCIERKANALEKVLNIFGVLINKVSCNQCGYEVFLDTFEGRTEQQKKWGGRKLEIIKLLGNKRSLESRRIKDVIGFIPWKNERRLNNHFSLIVRKRIGNDVEWSLNKMGQWVFDNLLKNNFPLKKYFQTHSSCPLCGSEIQKKLRGAWKTNDFEKDIYWARIKSIEFVKPTNNKVYDLVLPNNGSNEHVFVANGFIVHNSFGLNLPAWRVLIRDTKRFSGYGADYIPVLEIQQMCGRAGRPKYDSEGEAILIAKSRHEAQELWERYILGEPEPIYSKLSVEPVLRMHVLALIASEAATSRKKLEGFFSRTFFAHQYGDIHEVMKKVDKITKELESYKFISPGEFISSEFVPAFDLGMDVELKATKIGKRVSELYVDPLSASLIIGNLGKEKDIECLLAINQCVEMRPALYVKDKEYGDIEAELQDSGVASPDAWSADFEEFLASFKTTMMFRDWMNEIGEDVLLEKYGIAPGELYNKINNAEWLLFAAGELAKLLNQRGAANIMNKLRLRIRYGVKEELLPLIRLKNVGRVRARLLCKNGVKSFNDIKAAPLEKLEAILGKSLAKQLKERSEEDVDEKMKRFKIRQNSE